MLEVINRILKTFVKVPEVKVPKLNALKPTPSLTLASEVFKDLNTIPEYNEWLESLLYSSACYTGSRLYGWDSPRVIKDIPDLMSAPYSNVVRNGKINVGFTEWVLWYADGRVEVVRPRPTTGWSNANDPIPQFNVAPGQRMPKGVVRGAQIFRSISQIPPYDGGVYWELYCLEDVAIVN